MTIRADAHDAGLPSVWRTLLPLGLAILVFGAGLTSPIWFLLDGFDPLRAMHAGMPFVLAAIAGLGIATLLGITRYRLIPATAAEEESDGLFPQGPDEARWKHRIVHLLTALMFIVPFLSIALGFLLKRLISFDPG